MSSILTEDSIQIIKSVGIFTLILVSMKLGWDTLINQLIKKGD